MASHLWHLLAKFDSTESVDAFSERSVYFARLQNLEIIECLGGLDSILELTLTNEKIHNILNHENINKLKTYQKQEQSLVYVSSRLLTPTKLKHSKSNRDTTCNEFWDQQAIVNINCNNNLYYCQNITHHTFMATHHTE